MSRLTFLGTGNFLAPDRYWNSFVIDDRILVEPAPTALPHLRRAGFDASGIEVVVISHFHPDHTFGWPFLLLEFLRVGRDGPLHVVGPPGVEAFLEDMMRVGSVPQIQREAKARLDLRIVEIAGDGSRPGDWQRAGSLRFRAIEVDHVPNLRCFGFLFDVGPPGGARTVGYSGDTHPCRGLDELAAGSDVLVLECNGPHPPPPTHMDVADVLDLHDRHPQVRLILTHLGAGIGPADVPGAEVPDDFAVLEV